MLITGASGGVGHFAVQLAAKAGARVVDVVGSPERGEGLGELGADKVVTDIEDSSEPFDLILESTGGTSLTVAVRLVAPDGTVVIFGNSSGERSTLDFSDFFGSPRAKLYAFFVYKSRDAETFRGDLTTLVSLVAGGELRPQVGLAVSWRELDRA